MRRIFVCFFLLIFSVSVFAAEEKVKLAKVDMKVKATKNDSKQVVINLSLKNGEKEEKKVDYKIAYLARSTKVKGAYLIGYLVSKDVDVPAKKGKDVNKAAEYMTESLNKEGQKYAGWIVAAYADGEVVAADCNGCNELKKLAGKVFEQGEGKLFKVDKTGKELEAVEEAGAEKPAEKPEEKKK
ncbi:MAG: hypothetical protein RL095_2623 [Verrucomicrobiota bacterium]|jgi:hypothetical protein